MKIVISLPRSHTPSKLRGRILRHILFSVLILYITPSFATDQNKHFTLSNTHFVQLKSELTNRYHELVVVLPASYNSSPKKHYPVLYFMDAYWDTPLLSGIYNNLVWDNLIPELIMVGFSYPGENADYGDLRERDFTPTLVSTENPHSGNAAKFLQFIETTVIPHIESKYRIKSNERAISGNSLGGLLTLYAMYEKPELFRRFISISPAVVWDNQYLFCRDESYAKKNDILPVRLFLSQGSEEYTPFRDPIVSFQEKIEKHKYKGLTLLNYTIEGERHTSVKAEGYSRGLRWVFKDIAPTGPSGLEKAFNE